ncbi:MAG TPA: hypothetical protein VLL25_12810, partial [Acidimicrobiales bacterium]|nr:hypothetical protein [Acidimicrobiales bacterium]
MVDVLTATRPVESVDPVANEPPVELLHPLADVSHVAGRSRRRLDMFSRRRRVLAVLVGCVIAATALGSLPALRALLWLAAAGVAVVVIYLALLRHARHLAAEQEWASPLSKDDSLEWLMPDGAASMAWPAEAATAERQPVLEGWALVPFFLTCTADWLLTPIVAFSQWFAAGRDSQMAAAWAERIADVQTSMRQRSMRALTVSVVATIGVAGFGSLI